MRNKVIEKYGKILAEHPYLVTNKADIANVDGHRTEFLESLGLTKVELKMLERHGYVIRGYTPVCEFVMIGKNKYVKHFGAGHEVRWIILNPKEIVDEK